MKVKALKSFSGAVSMYAGEVRDIRTQAILDDLTAAGYIEPVSPRRIGNILPSSKKRPWTM